ncbi:MAG: RNA polymerase sigma factor [Acidimicrobiales bacterium]
MVSDPARSCDDAFDERALVERARVDADAFAELYRRYLPQVHAFAWRRTGSREAAEDICSATFEAVYRGLEGFRWRRGGFAPWLFRIAANQTVAHHRREGRPRTARGQAAMARLYEPTAEFHPDERGDDGDADALRSALDRLPPRYQRVLALKYLAGLDPDETARAMGGSKASTAVVASRALKALRRELRNGTTRGEAP